MPLTRLIFYQHESNRVPVLDWLRDLLDRDPKAYANCVARIQQLADSGYELRRPATDYLRDGIYELRAKRIRVQYRILYFYYGQNTAVLAHPLIKSDDAVPDIDIERAIAYQQLFNQDPNTHTYIQEEENE